MDSLEISASLSSRLYSFIVDLSLVLILKETKPFVSWVKKKEPKFSGSIMWPGIYTEEDFHLKRVTTFRRHALALSQS